MRVLIVSSEVLNPEQTYPSIFELSQARTLQKHHDVAILSVLERPALLKVLRNSLSNFDRSRVKYCARYVSEVIQAVAGRSQTCYHFIQGIPVFEGVTLSLLGTRIGFVENARVWCRAASAAYRRYLKTVGKPDVVHAHGRFLLAGEFARMLKQSYQIPYVYTEHSSFYQRNLAPEDAKSVLRAVVCEADAYTVVSRAVGNAVSGYVGTTLPEPTVVGNVLDELFIKEEAIVPLGRDTFTLLCVASLNVNKGIDFLLRSFAYFCKHCKGVFLKLCGDGPQRVFLEDLAESLGISANVQFMGQLSHAEILRAMDQAHALIVASSVETFGVVVIEAFARGRPVVSTRCGGPEELICESNGLLVERNDIQGMAHALKELVQCYERFDHAAIRQNCIETYGAAAFLQRMDKIYSMIKNRQLQ